MATLTQSTIPLMWQLQKKRNDEACFGFCFFSSSTFNMRSK